MLPFPLEKARGPALEATIWRNDHSPHPRCRRRALHRPLLLRLRLQRRERERDRARGEYRFTRFARGRAVATSPGCSSLTMRGLTPSICSSRLPSMRVRETSSSRLIGVRALTCRTTCPSRSGTTRSKRMCRCLWRGEGTACTRATTRMALAGLSLTTRGALGDHLVRGA